MLACGLFGTMVRALCRYVDWLDPYWFLVLMVTSYIVEASNKSSNHQRRFPSIWKIDVSSCLPLRLLCSSVNIFTSICCWFLCGTYLPLWAFWNINICQINESLAISYFAWKFQRTIKKKTYILEVFFIDRIQILTQVIEARQSSDIHQVIFNAHWLLFRGWPWNIDGCRRHCFHENIHRLAW